MRQEHFSAGPVDLAPAKFRQGMSNFASTVAVIATNIGGERRGLTATAVCSVSADPPTIAVCVNKASFAHDFILNSGRFSVNVLGVQDEAVAAAFAGGLKGEERFSVGDWCTGETGMPKLVSALTVFECSVVNVVDAQTHHVFIGRVENLDVGAGGSPLIYHNREYKRAQLIIGDTSKDIYDDRKN